MLPKQNLAKDKGVFGQQIVDANIDGTPIMEGVVEDVSDHSQTRSQGSLVPQTGERTITTADLN